MFRCFRIILSVVQFVLEHYTKVLEILILWGGLYLFYRTFRSTSGANIFLGIGVTLLFLTLISELLDLRVIGWILTRVVALLAFALIVIFQPELRSAFARVGSTRWFGIASAGSEDHFLEDLSDTVVALSKKRFGALIAIERSVGLGDFKDTGVVLDSEMSQSLVETIFHPKTTLHDGGIIISKKRIVAASCLFPVSQKELTDRTIGLRHRAGIGLTEETDAIAIIVSEETGKISLCLDGILEHGLTGDEFFTRLKEVLTIHEKTPQTIDEKLDLEADLSDRGGRDVVSNQ